MSFTKGNYEETARIVREGRDHENDAKGAMRGESYDDGYRIGFIDAYREMAGRLSAMFASDNPRFDAARFAKACEPKGEK